MDNFPIRVEVAEMPQGVAAILISGVEPDEMLPNETLAQALVRLKRAVVVKE